jgi:AcrR family transcriptional regulator
MLTDHQSIKRPKMQRADRRQAIVSAATRLFAERGFRGVTTRQIAAEVGVSEPVLYEHFKTKRDLYDAIVDTCSREGVSKAERLLSGPAEGADDRGYFLQLGELILDFAERNPEFMRLNLYSSLERHELADLSFERHVRSLYKMLREHVERRIAAGAFRPIDPMLAARAFVSMVYQYGLYEITLGFRLLEMGRDEVLEGMVDIFLNGVARK